MAASYPQRGGGVSSKIVKLGDTYGDLPVPTHTGYVFLGWRGRNLFSASQILYGKQSLSRNGITFTLQNDNSIILNGTASETDWAYTRTISILDFVENGETYFFYVDVDNVSANFAITNEDGTFSYIVNEPYTVTGEEVDIKVYIQAYKGMTYDNVKVYPMLEKGQKTQYEPYYIESDTVFGTPGDRTLTAVWSQDNILTGGALQTESDLENWSTGWGTSYSPEIVTYDGLSCFKLDLTLNALSMFIQSIKGKYEMGKYSITAKVNVVNAVAGVYDPNNPDYTYPSLLLYFPGYYGSNKNWMAIFDQQDLSRYNNKGWVNIRFIEKAHSDDWSSVPISDVTLAEAQIYCRNYSGTLYIRDFAIAKM